jgi:transposase InsO family protein
MPAAVEAAVLELRRVHRFWGPRRIRHELQRRRLVPDGALPSESAVYRCLVRAGLIEPVTRKRRAERFRRWERGRPMELWQMDTVGGFLLADGSHAKALTGVDDHSRFCISARLMPRERTRPVCEGLAAALRTYGVPQQLLTDNGKVFTGRFNHPATEVLFDRICRDNGIEHLLTQPRHPTTTGKIERFHRSLRAEFDTKRVFSSLRVAQQALDEWVEYYNTQRPHQSLDMATPAQRFTAVTAPVEPAATSGIGSAEPIPALPPRRPADTSALAIDRTGEGWVSRRVASNGVVAVAWQQISVGKYRGGENVDVYVDEQLVQIWSGPALLKTVTRTSTGPIRKKNASVPGGRV